MKCVSENRNAAGLLLQRAFHFADNAINFRVVADSLPSSRFSVPEPLLGIPFSQLPFDFLGENFDPFSKKKELRFWGAVQNGQVTRKNARFIFQDLGQELVDNAFFHMLGSSDY